MIRETTVLLLAVCALLLTGVLTVYSTTTAGTQAAEQLRNANEMYYVRRQAVVACVGAAFMLMCAKLNYRRLRERRVYCSIMAAALILLVGVLIPGIGVERNHAWRWLQVAGISFQPSEFAKLALIILIAVKVTDNAGRVTEFWRGFVPPMVVTFLFAALVVAERDLGTPVVIAGVALLMVLMAGARWWHVLGATVAASAAVTALCATNAYRWRRIIAHRDPWPHSDDEAYHLIQSLSAFARGGLWGQGAGAGQQKLCYLFAAHTDFAFASWAEETGLVGTVAVVLLFVLLITIGFKIAQNAPDLFGMVLAAGIVSLFTLQAAFNMAVATGLVPTKGLPLPFVSYGGTALVVNMALLGILISIALRAHRPNERQAHALAR